MNNYQLSQKSDTSEKRGFVDSMKKLWLLMYREKHNLIIAGIAVICSSGATLIAPIIIGDAIDTSIANNDYRDLFTNGLILFGVYCFGAVAMYVQTTVMGGIGRETLFHLRNQLFTKIQELPLSFFNQNKTGDLISRINNDTDKLNQFFSQAFTQFLGNFFLVVGSAGFIIFLSLELGVASLLPALVVVIITQLISPWVKRKTVASLQSLGGMSAEIQESLNNFKVVVAFNRMDYFTNKFEEFNTINYKAAISAGIAGNVLTPLYTLASNIAQLIFLVYGIHLIITGHITIGLFISFQIYLNNFYSPLKQLAAIWSSFQLALASIDRIYEVLDLDSDMQILPAADTLSQGGIIRFEDVSFQYPDGKKVLQDVNFTLEQGKTYALVGPTGGGKTTTAMLLARMYDPTVGTIYLDGKDIRSYSIAERTERIGFILQEPFLFTGTIKENILYGNDSYHEYSDTQLLEKLKELDLETLLSKFENGLETLVSPSGESISLGQKQIIAFMRAIIRSPDILILDEATANIDTITEEILESMLKKLPQTTTKIIIAHRLNTIKHADTIFFVNAGSLIETGNMEEALDMILHGKRQS